MAGFLDVVTNDTDENGITTQRRIHLNNDNGIFHIREWSPLAPLPEDLFQSSPFEDGRVLAMRKYGNVADEWTMDASAGCPSATDLELKALRAILKKAVDYWVVDWQTEPVWLEMQGDGESQVRYSYIYAWDIPQETNPFQPPRSGSPSLIAEFRLQIEHGFWMDSLTGTCVQLSNTQTYYDTSDASFVPTQSGDDAYVENVGGTIDLVGDFMIFGGGVMPFNYSAGIRFRSVAIPKSAVILNAFMEFEADANDAGDNCNIIISAEDADSSAVFSTYANFAGRTRTTTHTHWDTIAHWVAGTHYQTPDISKTIEETVGRAGWVSGNPLTLFLDNNISSDGAHRAPVTWDHAAARYEPHLFVWWYDTTTKTFGQTATCDPVYFADRHNMAQLTHAFAYDASLGTYSANIIGAALPVQLFPAAPAIGDMLYLICDTGVLNSGPFGSTVFDLSVIDAGMTGFWEYWNGAWVTGSLGTNDYTNGFRTLGVNIVNWEQVTDWATTTVNFITGYAVRFRVTAVGAGVPTQQNRDLYAVNTPFLDIAASQVGGDVAMLAELNMYELHPVSRLRQCQIVYVGLRSVLRGLNFSAYVNIADEQTPTGLSFTLGANSSWVTDASSETGRACYWNPTTTAWEAIVDINFTTALAKEYAGSFMSYLRMRLSTFSNVYWFKYQIITGAGQIYYESLIAAPLATSAGTPQRISACSFGEMITSIDPKTLPIPLTIRIYGMTSNAGNDCWLHTLIMIPNDEWIGHYEAKDYNTAFYSANHLNVDPITQIKLPDVAVVRDSSNNGIYTWDDKSPHFPRLWEKNRQRLWFFHLGGYGTGGTWYPACTHSGKVTINALKKYFGSWG